MDFLNVFSIMDFLAYLFPGILDTIGIYLLILLTPLKSSIQQQIDNFGGWVILILFSYIIGVIISGITSAKFRRDIGSADGSERADKIKSKMHITDPDLKKEIKDAVSAYLFEGKKEFTEVGDDSEWNKSLYYFCRSTV